MSAEAEAAYIRACDTRWPGSPSDPTTTYLAGVGDRATWCRGYDAAKAELDVRIRRLDLTPRDRVVVEIPDHIPVESALRLKAEIRAWLPDVADILVLTGGLRIALVGAQDVVEGGQ